MHPLSIEYIYLNYNVAGTCYSEDFLVLYKCKVPKFKKKNLYLQFSMHC